VSPELLQAVSKISRALGLLEGGFPGLDSLRDEANWPGVAANLREVARLCMAAAALIDPLDLEETDPLKGVFR
jgi:hypothetical protein